MRSYPASVGMGMVFLPARLMRVHTRVFGRVGMGVLMLVFEVFMRMVRVLAALVMVRHRLSSFVH